MVFFCFLIAFSLILIGKVKMPELKRCLNFWLIPLGLTFVYFLIVLTSTIYSQKSPRNDKHVEIKLECTAALPNSEKYVSVDSKPNFFVSRQLLDYLNLDKGQFSLDDFVNIHVNSEGNFFIDNPKCQ